MNYAFNRVMNGPPPKLWCGAYFLDLWSKSDMLCNNISNSFNEFTSEETDQPIITILENITIMLM